MTDHRKPCFPPTYDPRAYSAGNCYWCGGPLPKKKDGTTDQRYAVCPGECRERASNASHNTGAYIIGYFAERAELHCHQCGATDSELDGDHILPLADVDRTAPDAWKYWQPENWQLLCRDPCHKTKSAREAKQRAKEKRLRGETRNGAKRKIPSRPFSKTNRKLASRPLREARA